MSASGMLVTMRFIQWGIIWFLAVGLLFGLTFFIGWRRGGVPAYRYKRSLGWVFLAGASALAAWGYLTGEMNAFLTGWGVGSLLDMVGLGFAWVGTMWFMATSYSNSRMLSDHEARFAALASQVADGEDLAATIDAAADTASASTVPAATEPAGASSQKGEPRV